LTQILGSNPFFVLAERVMGWQGSGLSLQFWGSEVLQVAVSTHHLSLR
jgi:hypothetical protein